MAILIFNDFSELKPFISGGHITNDIEMLEGDLQSALLDKIIPLISQDAWDAIETSFTESSTDAMDLKALMYCRGALVNLGYYYYGIGGGIQATNDGLMQANSPERKSAFQWQSLEWRANKLDQGYMYLGKLLAYLEANKDHFTAWEGSEERSLYAKLFLRDLTVYNRYRRIAGFETIVALIPYMLRIQESVFANRITQTLFDDVYSEYQSGSLSSDNGPLVPYLQEYIAHQALCDALYELNFKFTAEGFRINSLKADQTNAREERAALEEISKAKNYLQVAADHAMGKLIQYLNENATVSKYPSYHTEVVLVEEADGNAIDNLNDSLKEGPTFVL
jgi:hypothetical protein